MYTNTQSRSKTHALTGASYLATYAWRILNHGRTALTSYTVPAVNVGITPLSHDPNVGRVSCDLGILYMTSEIVICIMY